MEKVKKISVSLPCKNEAGNVEELTERIIMQLETYCPNYDYEIQYVDNTSTDGTREKLIELCNKYKKVRAIFNESGKSPAHYGMSNTTGDCCIHMHSDFQAPPELIPALVREWEKGYKVVCAIKTSSEENKIMWSLRTIYYKLIKKASETRQLEHFASFGLFDREYIKIIESLPDPKPGLKGAAAEYGYKLKTIEYIQPKRKSGKSKNNFWSLIDIAINYFTTYTKIGIRLITLFGMSVSALSLITGMVYLILKLLYWDRFPAGIAPIIIAALFLGSMQILFLGLLGEYIIKLNKNVMKRPLVVAEERINFPDTAK